MTSTLSAERKPVFGSAKPVGPYSPGIIAGDYLYVSGQGARGADGKIPDTVEAQTRNCLENIKSIVEAAGLTMDHVVYTHAYLADMNGYAAMNQVYATYFKELLPARSTMGVARMPTDTPVEISAIAIRDKGKRKAVQLPGQVSPVPISPGILTPDRFFISGILGRDAKSGVTPATSSGQIEMALGRIDSVLKSAGLSSQQVLHLNVYRTAEMPREHLLSTMRSHFPEAALSLLEAKALPFGVHVGITGVAALKELDTVYCAAESGSDIRGVLSKVEACLRKKGAALSSAVASNVYLNNIDDFATMNTAYAEMFQSPFPTRTTIQPTQPGRAPHVTVSIVAVRKP